MHQMDVFHLIISPFSADDLNLHLMVIAIKEIMELNFRCWQIPCVANDNQLFLTESLKLQCLTVIMAVLYIPVTGQGVRVNVMLKVLATLQLTEAADGSSICLIPTTPVTATSILIIVI